MMTPTTTTTTTTTNWTRREAVLPQEVARWHAILALQRGLGRVGREGDRSMAAAVSVGMTTPSSQVVPVRGETRCWPRDAMGLAVRLLRVAVGTIPRPLSERSKRRSATSWSSLGRTCSVLLGRTLRHLYRRLLSWEGRRGQPAQSFWPWPSSVDDETGCNPVLLRVDLVVVVVAGWNLYLLRSMLILHVS